MISQEFGFHIDDTSSHAFEIIDDDYDTITKHLLYHSLPNTTSILIDHEINNTYLLEETLPYRHMSCTDSEP
jgi:hypothetical protein